MEKNLSAIKNIEDVIHYYNSCWLNRFAEGHNPKSYAIHLGMFKDASVDNDSAKIETNLFLIEALNIPNDKVLHIGDFGCGIGGTCMFLAANFRLASIFGINISKEQIDFAKDATKKKGLDNVEYVLANYCDTGLQSVSMDYVIAVESLFHADVKSDVFREAYRVLKEDGTFAFIDYFQIREAETTEERILLAQFNNGWGAYELGTGAIHASTNQYEKEIKDAGFSFVKSESLIEHAYQGIINSFEKANKKLNEEVLAYDLQKHYEACVALKILADQGIIDYRIVKAEK